MTGDTNISVPPFRPEQMRNLPDSIHAELKQTWENGLIMYYKVMEENPPDGGYHMAAKKEVQNFSNYLWARLQVATREPSTLVTIHVSAQNSKQSFEVNRKLLCETSPYFNATFDVPKSQSTDLNDVQPHIFGLFVSWLNTQDLAKANQKSEHANDMVSLWLLADVLGVRRLQNAAVEVLCVYRDWLPDPDLIRTVYSCTVSESPLRKLLATAYAHRSQLINFETTMAAFDGQIIRDMAVTLKNIASRSEGKKLTPASYYVNYKL